ncbi:hypothetical protein CPB84DRAFT_1383517 [Gymnopilus junonius]|uniref:Uncharacterized protein n=1 Tax=Gymnopilus junonius TaxID=109634 RepID=A0A9P5NJR0_GYMJU|nr:hypothetical protein CPB84DRAFT_1383517 [Gymnopilus junonius]
MGDNRNKSPYHQTLTGFALAAAAASRSPRTPKAAAHHVTPIVSRSEGAGIGSPSTPTPTPGPMRGTRAQTSSGVPPAPAAQAPSTPPPPARVDKLPTLTELLASDRKKKEKKKKVRTSVSGSTSVPGSGVKPASSPTKGKGKFTVEPIREVPESDLEEGWVGSGVGAGAIATASADVEAIADAAAATTGESERQVQAEIQNEPQSAQSLNSTNTNGFPHSNNSYPNAPAYSYPITEDNHNFLHPHSLLDLVDPHADVDPYADPPPPCPNSSLSVNFTGRLSATPFLVGRGGMIHMMWMWI